MKDKAQPLSTTESGSSGSPFQATLRSQIAELSTLLPSETAPQSPGKEDLQKSLAILDSMRTQAAENGLSEVGRVCEVSIRLLEDARTIGYSPANHGYVTSTVLPFLEGYADQLPQLQADATEHEGREDVLKDSTSDLFQNFYDFVSANQRIAVRMKAFEDPRSYHYKDLHYIRSMLGTGGEVSTVLDVGCCGTVYPKLFDLERVEYTGVDISQRSLDRMNVIYEGERIRWLADDATTLDLVADNSIDLILATQVLEHLPDPEKALASMVKKPAPGGRLMIGTESALCQGRHMRGRLRRVAAACSLLMGSYYLVHGMFPHVFPHRESHSYVDLEGEYRNVSVPHFHFHPLFFQRAMDEQNLPARASFLRVSGLISFYGFGPSWHFRLQELKARLPLLRYIGSQVFVVIEKAK